MAEEIVKVIKIETAGGQQTVRGLRDEIKSLRDDLLNVNKGTKEYDEILGKLINDEKQLTDVMRAGKNEVSAATGSYNALQNEMTALRKVWKEVTDEAQRAEIGARINELNQELKDLDASIGNNSRKVGSYEEALKSVTSQYTSQRAELKALRVELEQLEPGTEAYNQAFSRAAEITHNIAEQQEMLKYASNDLGDQLSNLRGIAANVAAGFSAAQAAIGLFGGESEEVQQAMLKVQQAMALVQGLEGLDGFIKRTQGLSTAIQGWIAQSKTATVQTTAQATATKAAAAATNAETVATKGATVAQKGLNAAIKSNPIGFIIGLIALLVVNWKKLTEWLGKAVGGFDKVTKAMNKFKATVSGVAKAISKVLLVPIKEAINYVVTLGKVLKDVFTLNWDEIGKDIKDGINNSVNIVKDGYDVASNYAKGKEEEMTRQANKEAKERAKQRANELDKAIELKEAQNDSDWKYTEEGKAMYAEYFANLEKLYKDDAEKYHEYQVQKASYDKGLTDYNNKVKEDADKKAEEERKKAVEAAKKAQEELKKIEDNYLKLEKEYVNSYKDVVKEYETEIDSLIAYFSGKTSSMNMEFLQGLKIDLQDVKNDIVAFFKSLNDVDAIQYGSRVFEAIFLSGTEDFKDFMSKSTTEMLDELKKLEEIGLIGDFAKHVFTETKFSYLQKELFTRFNALLNDAITNSGQEASIKLNDEIIRLFQKTIRPKVSEELAKLQNEIDKETIKLDFEIETGMDGDAFMNSKGKDLIPIEYFDRQATEFKKAADIYDNSLKQLEVQLNFYQKTVDYVKVNGLSPSDEYENAVKMVEQLTNQVQQLYVDYYNTNAEIRDRYFAEDLQKIQTNAANEERLVKKHYDELYTQNSLYLNGRRELSGTIMKYDIQAAEETYQIQKNSLEEQLAMYQSYLNDVTVAGEQRVEAEKIVAELIAEIEEGEVAHTREMNQLRIQSFQMWYSYAQDAIGGIGDLFGGLADYYEADIKAKQANNEISEEQANEMYEKVKALKISEAIISTISGAIGAFMQAVAAYPPPYGEILGGISAAAVTAAGMAQVAQIKQQNLGSNGGSVKAMATPQTEVYQPEYTENPTGDNEISNLRNAYMNQPIRAYVVEADITDSQKRANTRNEESTF